MLGDFRKNIRKLIYSHEIPHIPDVVDTVEKYLNETIANNFGLIQRYGTRDGTCRTEHVGPSVVSLSASIRICQYNYITSRPLTTLGWCSSRSGLNIMALFFSVESRCAHRVPAQWSGQVIAAVLLQPNRYYRWTKSAPGCKNIRHRFGHCCRFLQCMTLRTHHQTPQHGSKRRSPLLPERLPAGHYNTQAGRPTRHRTPTAIEDTSPSLHHERPHQGSANPRPFQPDRHNPKFLHATLH